MTPVDTLISARWVLPIAPTNFILENYSVAITAGRITALLPNALAQQQLIAQQHIQLKDHVLMPGLVNAHSHSSMTLFRGLADDLPLMDWLQKHIWPAEQAIINEKSVIDGTSLAILEMIRGGTTCFADHFFFHDTIAQVSRDMGIRSCIGMVVIQVPTAWAKNEAEYLRKAQNTLETQTKHPLITWSIAPHSPYMVSDNALMQSQQLAEQFDIPFHIHLHETKSEIEQSLAQYQQRPIARLAKLGIITARLFAAHLVHMNAEDLKLYAPSGASAVHCPESNLKLGSGFAPISAMLKQGINVALGTDGAASNNDLDMFGELRCAALIAKALEQDPTILPASTALAMATINGAQALGLAHEIGSLEVGKAADIIAIDMNHYLTQPVYNPISHLAYAVNRLQVSDVWIAGKHLLKQGEFTELDPQILVRNAEQWAERAKPFGSFR